MAVTTTRDELRAARAKQARTPNLRLVRGGGREAAAAWRPEDYGHPSVQHRCDGHPVEIRIWTRRPERVAEAVYHPAGVWICLRVV
jgi:hypothetical protein